VSTSVGEADHSVTIKILLDSLLNIFIVLNFGGKLKHTYTGLMKGIFYRRY
jgi:hypothetical protein